jgi:hypothetical protein
MLPILFLAESGLRRQSESGGFGAIGCFVVILVIGAVLYLVMKGRRDRPEQLGTAKRAMGSGPIADHTFATPYAKCPTCSASGDKMKQQWDGLRKVTWTCGYCGNLAGVQELKDEELPPSARQQLGLDLPQQSLNQNFPGQGGGGVGGILTGMMIGSMLGGSGHHHREDDWGGGGSGGGSDSSGGNDWGDSGSGGDSGGSDWGDSSGGDSGGGDSGGGDSGGSDW